MAENERLDVLKNKRWKRVMLCIQAGASEADAARLIGEALTKTLRNVIRQVPIAELLRRAAEGDPKLRHRAIRCRHDFAELVAKIAAEGLQPGQPIALQYMEAMFDRFSDQMGVALAGCQAFPTFDDFVGQSSAWKGRLREELRRLAGCLMTDVADIRVQPQPAEVRAADRRRLADLSLLDRRGANS